MSCIEFKSNQKNNKWREVELNLQKENDILKFFGVDTETNVDVLLQHNLTLFDWIRKNQGFPYFIGRRINGDKALTENEMNYIVDNGSKVLPIFRLIFNKDGKFNAKVAVAILEELNFEKGIPVFLELDANNVKDEFLRDFATEVISGGYTPGFYVDTDSYYNFDRQYSRAYQADEHLMKQCKIWALSPEMEEFYETKDAHYEKPDIWGPFAPSCITKEQISIWQYGKKAHPVNAYNGERTDFNLNLTIEPYNVLEVKDVEAVTFNFNEDEKGTFSACVKSENGFENVSLECDFNRVKSESLLLDNKIYAKNIVSEHKILEFVICENNDLFTPKYVVTEGTVLIKFAFVSNEKSCIYYLRKLISLDEYEVLKKIISEADLIEDNEEILRISKQEIWKIKCLKQNNTNISNGSGENNEVQDSSEIKNYCYKQNGDIFEAEIISPSLMRSTIVGDTYNIFATIPQSSVKSVGSRYCTIKDAEEPAAAYFTDTTYDSGLGFYMSYIAIWNLDADIQKYSGDSSRRVVEFEYKRAYNAIVYYYPDEDTIEVVYADDNYSYIATSQTQISINLVGEQTAYIENCSFEVCLGGKNNNNNFSFFDAALGGLSKVKIVGALASKISKIRAVYSTLTEIANTITNYNYDKEENKYKFYSKNGLYTKQAGSTFYPTISKKNSALKLRAILSNVNVYSDSAVYFQVETTVLSVFAGGNRVIRFGGAKSLE